MKAIHQVLSVLFCLAASGSHGAVSVIDARMYHLGTLGFPEWSEYAGKKPHGRELHLDFELPKNAAPTALLIRQAGVKQGWGVYLNGKRAGFLDRIDSRLDHRLAIPAGSLRAGTNRLSVRAPKRVDDIEVGHLRWLAAADEKLFDSSGVAVTVRHRGAPVPCRLTITHPDGTLAALTAQALPAEVAAPAVRDGVVYTANGRARLGLLPGRYVLHASRGFEFGLRTRTINVAAGKVQPLELELIREVDTDGWVSLDSHIHVRDFSGHGDSTVQERMLTIAGEGLQVGVSTDHNHHADYAPAARETGVAEHFTTVIGNEVTTKGGHFNAFPIRANQPLPDHSLTNWGELLKSVRGVAGVRVVQLNHPRNVHGGYSPTDTNEFDWFVGSHRRGVDFDALEVVTSAAMQSDIMVLFHDWFALLNHGHRVVGVASSDTHDVSRFILGQARTYVAHAVTDAGRIDVDAVCEGLLAGRAVISMGLLPEIVVDGRHRVGDRVKQTSRGLSAKVRVRSPSWAKPDRVRLFANGVKVADRRIKAATTEREWSGDFRLAPLPNDAHLVVVVTGPGVMSPHWETPRPYQPTDKNFVPLLIGATNPVWIDADGDGRHHAARATAQAWLNEHTPRTKAPVAAPQGLDAAVLVQLDALLRARGSGLETADLTAARARLRAD